MQLKYILAMMVFLFMNLSLDKDLLTIQLTAFDFERVHL
ncbi:hypothetical protein C3B79_1380 [Aeromonas hydrophila]|nr:hypothetical protein C3B79_1380 [Aeromonas hydrophila]